VDGERRRSSQGRLSPFTGRTLKGRTVHTCLRGARSCGTPS
jgi:dihydroorotase-like cyclic amidohydrolase